MSAEFRETVDELNQSRFLPFVAGFGAAAVLAGGLVSLDNVGHKDHSLPAIAAEQELLHHVVPSLPEVAPSPVARPHSAPKPSRPPQPKTEAKPSPTSVALPKQPAHVVAAPPHTAEKRAAPLHLKNLSFSQVRAELPSYVSKLPTLPELGKAMPDTFPDVDKQLAFITQLNQDSAITAQDVHDFTINVDHRNAFAGTSAYTKSMTPRAFLWHWTAQRYENVDQFISSIHNAHKSVEFFIDRTGTVYQLFDNDHRFPAHALGLNDATQGVEIEATNLYDYTPAQIKAAKLLSISFLRRNQLQAGPTTLMTHLMADLLINNPFYNDATGTFHVAQGQKPSLRKPDGPRELVDYALPEIEKYA